MKSYQPNQYGSGGDTDTVEKERPVSRKIKTIRIADCDKLQGLIGELTQLEENTKGSKQIVEAKRCCVINTEYNYQVYRNLEFCVGIELTQAAIEIKTDITAYMALSDAVATALKKVVAATKDAKQKFDDLAKAAYDLRKCLNDKCNCTQLLILTGDSPCSKDDPNRKPIKPACPDADEILKKLTGTPEHLFEDSRMVFSSAADITGIQTFTNIKSLDALQTTLTAGITDFTTLVGQKKTQSATDLTQCQTDLTTAIVDLTKSEYALYNKRDETDAEKETIEFLCKDECNCKGRMRECKDEICDICKEMDNIYCERRKPEPERKTVEM